MEPFSWVERFCAAVWHTPEAAFLGDDSDFAETAGVTAFLAAFTGLADFPGFFFSMRDDDSIYPFAPSCGG